jgi:hypothetical protein
MRQCRNRKRHRDRVLVSLGGTFASLLFHRGHFIIAIPQRVATAWMPIRARSCGIAPSVVSFGSLKASSSPCVLSKYLRYIAVARQLVFVF